MIFENRIVFLNNQPFFTSYCFCFYLECFYCLFAIRRSFLGNNMNSEKVKFAEIIRIFVKFEKMFVALFRLLKTDVYVYV